MQMFIKIKTKYEIKITFISELSSLLLQGHLQTKQYCDFNIQGTMLLQLN